MGCMLFYMIMSFVTAGMLCIVIALCFLTNPAPKYLLKGIKAQDITSIKVFDGNNGQEFIIEEPKEIVEIVENFQSTPMKREKSSIGYMGYRFRMTFTDKEGKEIEQFILNQKNTIREDPFFYTSEQPLCYDYIEQLEQKYLGSASEESAKGNKRKEPPKLQVSYREDVVTASTLTYSWKVFHEDGTVAGGEADSPHPLDIIDKLPKIPIDYGSNQVFFAFERVEPIAFAGREHWRMLHLRQERKSSGTYIFWLSHIMMCQGSCRRHIRLRCLSEMERFLSKRGSMLSSIAHRMHTHMD